MKNRIIQERTYQFALDIIKFVKNLPHDIASICLAKQLIRSGTSIGANTEEAQGASSRKDFINKINIAKKEARETRYWLKLINDSQIAKKEHCLTLLSEIDEIINILTAIVKTSEKNEKLKS